MSLQGGKFCDGWDTDAQTRQEVAEQRRELEALRARLDYSLSLLKQAGDNLDIRTSQEVRALRFKILQFLEGKKVTRY